MHNLKGLIHGLRDSLISLGGATLKSIGYVILLTNKMSSEVGSLSSQ